MKADAKSDDSPGYRDIEIADLNKWIKQLPVIGSKHAPSGKGKRLMPKITWSTGFFINFLSGTDKKHFINIVENILSSCRSEGALAGKMMLYIDALYTCILNSFSVAEIAESALGSESLSGDGEKHLTWVKNGHYLKKVTIAGCSFLFRVQRIYCKETGQSHAVFPDGLIPFIRENLADVYLYFHQLISHQGCSLNEFSGRIRELLEQMIIKKSSFINSPTDCELSKRILAVINNSSFFRSLWKWRKDGIPRAYITLLHLNGIRLSFLDGSSTQDACVHHTEVVNSFMSDE